MGMRFVKKSIQSFKDYSKSTLPHRKLAKRKLRIIKKHMDDGFEKSSNYLDVGLQYANYRSEKYFFGDANSSSLIKKYCEKCIIEPGNYLIAGIGNLDDDPDMDIVTIDEEGKIELLNDDLQETINEE